MDLNEMQWHVSYSSRNEARIKERVEIAEVLNQRLKEDIEFVKKHMLVFMAVYNYYYFFVIIIITV